MTKFWNIFNAKWCMCSFCTICSIMTLIMFGTLFLITHTSDKLAFASGGFGALIICLIWILSIKALKLSSK